MALDQSPSPGSSRADFHAVLDQLEEPEQMLKQAIRDMEDELARDGATVLLPSRMNRNPSSYASTNWKGRSPRSTRSSTFASSPAASNSRKRWFAGNSKPSG